MPEPKRPYDHVDEAVITNPILEVLKELQEEDGIVRQIYEDWPHFRHWPEVLIWIVGSPTTPGVYEPLDTELARIGWYRGTCSLSEPEGSRFTRAEVWHEIWTILPTDATVSRWAEEIEEQKPKWPDED